MFTKPLESRSQCGPPEEGDGDEKRTREEGEI